MAGRTAKPWIASDITTAAAVGARAQAVVDALAGALEGMRAGDIEVPAE